jgi:MFS family permease
MNKTLSVPRMLILNAYWVGLSFMWNALHPIVLPALLLSFVPAAKKNTYLGLLTFAGLLLALILQPLAGAATDHWNSPFGRRRPLMVIGTILDFAFLGVLAWSGGFIWLVVGYIGLQLSSNLAQGPLQGLLRDQVPENQLGTASSIKICMDVSSLIAASLLAGRSLGAQSNNPVFIMLFIIVLLAASSSITILWTKEAPSTFPGRPNWNDLASQFSIDVRRHADYWWLIAQRALFLMGVYGVQAFAEYYLLDVLHVPDPVQATGQLLAAIAAGVLLLVLVGGWLTDRVGAKQILYLAGATTAGGILLFLFMSTARGLPLAGSVLGGGIGLFLTSNWALVNRLAPMGEAGKFLGLTNLATAGASALVRLQGPLVDLLNASHPSDWLGYRGLFAFCAACVMLSTAVLVKIPSKT